MTCDRRQACKSLVWACAGLAGTGLTSPGCGTDQGTISFPPADGGTLRLPFADFPMLLEPGGWARGRPANLTFPVLVVHHGDGMAAIDFAALNAACTHRACGVNYDPGVALIECPCHGAQFLIDGAVVRGPATLPLGTLAVAITEDVLEIDVTTPG